MDTNDLATMQDEPLDTVRFAYDALALMIVTVAPPVPVRRAKSRQSGAKIDKDARPRKINAGRCLRGCRCSHLRHQRGVGFQLAMGATRPVQSSTRRPPRHDPRTRPHHSPAHHAGLAFSIRRATPDSSRRTSAGRRRR